MHSQNEGKQKNLVKEGKMGKNPAMNLGRHNFQLPFVKTGGELFLSLFDLHESLKPDLSECLLSLGGPAHLSGLRQGDSVMQLNGLPVETWKCVDLAHAIRYLRLCSLTSLGGLLCLVLFGW